MLYYYWTKGHVKSRGWLSQSISDLTWSGSRWTHNPCAISGQNMWPFFLPTIQSSFQGSCNGYPPVIRNISLYLWYEIECVIIIMGFLVSFISITHLNHIIWGWAFPLTVQLPPLFFCYFKLLLFAFSLFWILYIHPMINQYSLFGSLGDNHMDSW